MESSVYHNPESLVDPIMKRQPEWVKRMNVNFKVDIPTENRQKR